MMGIAAPTMHPHNEEAEQALLGAILVSGRAYEKVSDFLKSEHFYDPAHQRIFDVISKVIDRGQVANPVTLKAYFENDQTLAGSGGAAYLAELAANAVTIVNAADYGRTIRDHFLRRQLIEVGHEMIGMGAVEDDEVPVDARLEEAQSMLFALAERQDGNAIIPARAAVDETMQRLERAWKSGGVVTGVTTGLHDLDALTGGLKPGQLVILAARPAMGKTALAVNTVARLAARAGTPVGVFSAEMTRDELIGRWLAAETGITTQDQDQGRFDQGQWLALQRAAQDLARLPVHIDDSDTLTPVRLRQRTLRMRRQHKIGLIVVDHLQRMSGDRTHRSDYEERSAVVKACKSIAKAAGIPMLLLCQLSRAVEQRDDKRPQLPDLRESGRIEEEADIVIGLYRDEYYAEKEMPQQRGAGDDKYHDSMTRWEQRMTAARGIADILVLKQRGGRTGSVRAHYDGPRTLFSDLARNF